MFSGSVVGLQVMWVDVGREGESGWSMWSVCVCGWEKWSMWVTCVVNVERVGGGECRACKWCGDSLYAWWWILQSM